ncbi:STAS domain-containing protein [bacterium]|nr:STAS domain-containing protein [bacterium]
MSTANPGVNAPKCDVRVFRRDNQDLLVLDGSLVLQNSEKVRTQIHDLLDGARPNVDIFLGQLGFIDSSGLGVLVGFHVTARKNKVELRLLAPTAPHMHLFEATRLNSIFKIMNSAESAPILAELAVPEFEVK